MDIEIKIVQGVEGRKKEIGSLSNRLLSGNLRNKHTIIVTTELFAKLFSPKRLDLLMTLAKKESINITDLANRLKRKFEVVYRDLKLFEHFGLVKFVKDNNSVIPELIGNIKLPTIA